MKISILAYFSILLLLSSCTPQSEDFRLGVSIPQTGVATQVGESFMRGLDLAKEENNADLSIFVEDDQCNAKEGLTTTKKLIEENHVDMILGPICTVAILSSSQYVEEQGIPRITTGVVLQKVAEAGPNHFSTMPEMKHQMRRIMQYAKEQEYVTISVLAVNDDLGRESIDELQKVAMQEGIVIIQKEYFERGENQFQTVLLKLAEKNPDAIYLMGYVPELINILTQKEQLQIGIPALTWSLFQDPAVLEMEKTAETVVYTYPEDPRSLAKKEHFKNKYWEKYGAEPDIYAANGYDTYLIAVEVSKSCGKNHNCIREYLSNVQEYEGANGFITVDARGVGQREEVSVKTVREKKFIILE